MGLVLHCQSPCNDFFVIILDNLIVKLQPTPFCFLMAGLNFTAHRVEATENAIVMLKFINFIFNKIEYIWNLC